MKDLLEVQRVQRHNFVNHLQVISGLLQLKKYDRALEYIRQVGEEYNQAGQVGRLEIPEITSAILVCELACAKKGIAIQKRITTNLDKGLLNPSTTAELIKEMLADTSALVEGLQEKSIDLRIDEEVDCYIFEVSCQTPQPAATDAFNGILAFAEAASDTGNALEVVASDVGVVLTLKSNFATSQD